MKYRPEIDGLRALAVIPVILFHAGVDVFSGGYIGVDVFFVISGYLITSIILDEKEDNRFSLANFYERRARRILPALFFVVLCCVPLAWFLMLPSEMEKFAKSIVGVATFSSNFLFWQESGYFDTDSELKPLLHTWSLAVEEQFYILFPLFILFMWKYGKRTILGTLIVLVVFSLLLAQWSQAVDPSAAFFLIPTRCWELILGIFCAFYLHGKSYSYPPNLAYILSLLGVLLIGYSIFAFNESTPTPSFYTLVPTLGTALIILFANKDTAANRILSVTPLVGMGLISYSAYLWHHPILSFTRYWTTKIDLSFTEIAIAIVLTVLLSIFTWRWIERPFRKRELISSRYKFLSLSISSIVLIAVSGLFLRNNPITYLKTFLNFSSPPVTDIREINNDEAFDHINIKRLSKWNRSTVYLNNQQEAPNCRVLVIGDSHAGHLRPFLEVIASKEGCEIHLMTSRGCPPLFGHYKMYDITQKNEPPYQAACKEQTMAWEEHLKVHEPQYTHVILSSRWNWLIGSSSYGRAEIRRDAILPFGHTIKDKNKINRQETLTNALRHTAGIIDSAGAKTIVISQPPLQMFHLDKVKSLSDLIKAQPAFEDVVSRQSLFDEVINLSQIQQNFEVNYIRTVDFFCDEKDEICHNTIHRNSLYQDEDHMSPYGSHALANWLLNKYPTLF